MMPLDLAHLHGAIVEAAQAAGRIALRDYVPGGPTGAQVDWKAGGSPVTSADLAVDAFLRERLGAFDTLAFHSEERPDSWQGMPLQRRAFVIDPIDGTRDFSLGGEDWCIVIGVLNEGSPAAGVVHMPARGQTFSAFAGGGAFLDGAPLRVPLFTAGAPLRATGPKAVYDDFGAAHALRLAPARPVPALAHRLLHPLTGGVDIALARPGGHDWDIVASDCILNEAGAALATISGKRPHFELAGQAHPALIAASRSFFETIPAFDLTARA